MQLIFSIAYVASFLSHVYIVIFRAYTLLVFNHVYHMVMSISAGFTLFNYVFLLFVFNSVLYGVIIVIFNFIVFAFCLYIFL